MALTLAGIGIAATSGPATPAEAAVVAPLVITPNPAYQNEAFEGWGTSLVWFANATGDYPEDVRQELFEKVFGEDGLNLNIARYNIGGGNASDVPPYLRQGAAVDGWWNPDLVASDGSGAITSDYADRDRYAAAWNPDDPASYDLTADETQRWWVNALKDKVTKWEAFSNSPPYFMTQSGYVSGGTNSSAEQLKPESVDDFVSYLTTVAESVEQQEGIRFTTIDPFNEPNTNYWGTTIDQATGWPKKGGQEGAHIGPAMQDTVIKALAKELADPSTTTDATISAMDETNPGLFVTDWAGWSAEARNAVDQLNVHTYGTSRRVEARDIAKTADKNFWMSEIEGDWDGTGVNNQTNINNGIGVATQIMDDLRELEPSAWVMWQPVEDAYNMQKVEKKNWGSVQIDFDCNADGNSERRLADGDADPSCKVQTNAKYNTIRNFTHYIRPGDHMIPSTNTQTTAAVTADGTGVNLVHANSDADPRTITVDLSKFATIAPGATLTPIVTTASPADDPTKNALVEGTAVAIDANTKSATLTVPGKSVSTFVITGVSGVSDAAVPLRDGHDYQLVGSQSGKALTANDAAPAGTVPAAKLTSLAATADAAAPQVWTAARLTDGNSNSERFVFRSAGGKVLAATSAGTVLVDRTADEAAADPTAQWMLTTTTGQAYSLVNVGLVQALEVGGQSTAENAPVGVYASNSGANQSWSFRDTELVGFSPVAVNTIAGVPPVLPTTVAPLYRQGPGSPVAVTWATEGIDWNSPTSVTVQGSGTDLFGTPFDTATAIVDIGGFEATDPVSLTTFAGASLDAVVAAAPATVPARIGESSNRFDAAATWDWTGLSNADFAQPGVVTVPGSAASNDPSAPALPATLSVIVTTADEENIAPAPTTTASASSTENGYPVDRTRNRILDDKGWSNWVSTNKPASSTLGYDLGGTRSINHVTVRFYKDGSTESWPTSMVVEYLDPTVGWTAAPGSPTAVPTPSDGTAPVVDVAIGGVDASQLRVVLTARPNTHMIVSEVEIYALTPSASTVSSLARLAVGGTQLDGFDPATLAYEAHVAGSALPQVQALPVDTRATVDIDQASETNGAVATITVTAEDGTSTSVYSVSFARTILLPAPVVTGTGVVGQPLSAATVADPSTARLSYAWSRNGEAIPSATGAGYTPTASDTGATLTVTATADADGYTGATAVSAGIVVTAAGTPTDPTNPADPTGPANPSGTGTAGTPGTAGTTGPLANTGFEALPFAAIAVLAILAGLGAAAAVRVRRRRA